MRNIDYFDSEQFTISFVDERRTNTNSKRRIHAEPMYDKFQINLADIFQKQPPEHMEKECSNKFFSSKFIKPGFPSRKQLSQKIVDEGKSQKIEPAKLQTLTHIQPENLDLKEVRTLLMSAEDIGDIETFMSSMFFSVFIKMIIIANMLGICLVDYSFRLTVQQEPHAIVKLSGQNIASLILQLLSNCVFSLEIILQMMMKQSFFDQPYKVVNLIGTFACWATIFYDPIKADQSFIFQIFITLRIIRGVIKLIETFDFLKKPFQIFIRTIPSLDKLFFPLIVIMLFYAITGMTLFKGANNSLCLDPKSTSHPHEILFCGSSFYSCPEGTQCITQDNHQLAHESESMEYGLINFDNIGNALLTVCHFLFLTNWTNIKNQFSHYINPYLSSVFFISMVIFLFYIISNLIMLSMSKAYFSNFEKQENLQDKSEQEQQTQKEQVGPSQHPYIVKALKITNLILIIIHSIILTISYENMPTYLCQLVLLLDFIFSIICIVILILMVLVLRSQFLKESLNIIEVISLAVHFGDIVICAAMGTSVIYSVTTASKVLRSIKIIRITRILYFSKSIFSYEKHILQLFLKTLNKVKFFLLLFVCFIIMFMEIGKLLFAFRVRYLKEEVTIQGHPLMFNFQSGYKSMISVLLLFYNDRWSEVMYSFYHAVGFEAVFFFFIVASIAHLMLMRLYIAVFLCSFKEQLHKMSQKQTKNRQMFLKTKAIPIKVAQTSEQSNSQSVGAQHVEAVQAQQKMPTPDPSSSASSASSQTIFWCIRKDSWLIMAFRKVYTSRIFFNLMKGVIFVHCLTVLVRVKGDSQTKEQALQIIERICFAGYIVQVLLGFVANGIYFETDSYLKQSKCNFISVLVVILIILAYLPFYDELYRAWLRRTAIIKLFTIFRQTDKEMTIILDTVFQITKRFVFILAIYALFLYIGAIIPLKLLGESSGLYSCVNNVIHTEQIITNAQKCYDYGGDWVETTQSFSNIFTSITLMYEIVTSESWSQYLITLQQKNQQYWDIFFVIVFFVYNICFLNVFLGFIVETYLHLKDMAYNLNLLKPSQKGWIVIKNSINHLIPSFAVESPAGQNQLRCFIYKIVTNDYYAATIDYLAYLNVIVYALEYSNASDLYKLILGYIKSGILAIFLLDFIAKIFSLRKSFLLLDNSTVQIVGFVYTCVYIIINVSASLDRENTQIIQFILSVFLLLRCKRLLFKYSWSKTHINSVIQILPKCLKIIKLVGVILFVYVSLGMQIFQYTKNTHVADGYLIGFETFLSGSLTLIKITSLERWFEELYIFSRASQPNDVCFQIYSLVDAQKYPNMGCGSWVAYPFFLSFHMVMALLIINLLIATMASAYDQNYEKQYNSVNIFQLEDCLNLWQKYDPAGQGVVHYKKFWKLTSQIAILFGISKRKLIKRKQKFLEQLDIPMFQSTKEEDPLYLVYRFHDVITKFSKIKLQVASQKIEGNQQDAQIEFDINPAILEEIKDYVTPFPQKLYKNYKPYNNMKSGETKYIFGLLKKLRRWRHAANTTKKIYKEVKLSRIFDCTNEKKMELDSFMELELKKNT